MATANRDAETRQYDDKEAFEHVGDAQDSGMPAADPENEILPSNYYTSWQFLGSYLAIIFTAIGLFVSYTMPVSSLSVINAEIGPSSSTSIVPLLHTLLKGVMLLLIGRFSDIFGRRWVLICGQALCAVGSIPCALASDINMLIGGTVIVALGGGVQPLYPLLCQEVVPNKYRGLSTAILTVLILPFMGFGGVFARLLVQNTELGWRWIYWMNCMFCTASAVLYYLCYRPPKFEDINGRKSKLQQLKELDYLGLVLYSGGAIAVLLGFVWSTDATKGGWSSATVIGLIVVGGVSLIAFALWETFAKLKTPLLPLKLLKIKGFVPMIGVGVVGQMGFYGFNIFAPQIAQRLYTTKNIEIGLIASLANIGLAIGEIISGFAWKYVKHNRIQIILACSTLALWTGLMALISPDRMAWILANIMLAGISIGWLQLLLLINCGLIPPINDIGLAQGFFGSCRNIGGSIATSIFVSVFGIRTTQTLESNIPGAVTNAGLPESSLPDLFAAMALATKEAFEAVPGMTSSILQALDRATKKSYSESFQTVYFVAIGFSVVSLGCAFFVANVDHLMTGQLNKRIDGSGNTAAAQEEMAREQGEREPEEKGGSRV